MAGRMNKIGLALLNLSLLGGCANPYRTYDYAYPIDSAGYELPLYCREDLVTKYKGAKSLFILSASEKDIFALRPIQNKMRGKNGEEDANYLGLTVVDNQLKIIVIYISDKLKEGTWLYLDVLRHELCHVESMRLGYPINFHQAQDDR